jgi:exodeoxyribonuclease VII small subunit
MVGASVKKTAKKSKKNEASFEALIERLDAVVDQLEQGDLPLEDSIALFEEGMGLTRAGMARLDDADRKVNQLLQEDGQETQAPFDLDGGGES